MVKIAVDAHRALSAEVARLEALKALDDELKEVGSLNRLAKEAQAKLDEASGLLDQKNAEIEATNRNLAQAQASVEQAKATAGRILREADTKSGAVMAQLQSAKEASVAEAKNREQEALEKAAAILRQADTEASEIAAEAAKARDQLAAVNQQIDAANKTLAGINAETDRLRNLFAVKG